MTGRPSTSPKPGRRTSRTTGPAAPGPRRDAIDIDALLADRGTRDHRVLWLRRRGQDHDVGRAGAARGRAGTSGLRPDDRPGAASRPVDGSHRARQHPAHRRGRQRHPWRAARRDDARHEAHLRRGRRGALDAGEGPADPGEPVLPVALSSSFAGTQEYMAMEKLGQLHAESVENDPRWDLIVVDTPPSRSALDFLDAPERLSSLLDGRFMRLMVAPARGPARLLSAGFGLVTGALNKVLGAQFLTDVQAFTRRPRHPVRRIPAARRGHLLAAAGGRHGVRRGRRAGDRRDARGGLLRRAAVGREDAAGRPGRQPHASRRHRGHHRRRRRVGRTQARVRWRHANAGRQSCSPYRPNARGCRSVRHAWPSDSLRHIRACRRCRCGRCPATCTTSTDSAGSASCWRGQDSGGLKDRAPGRHVRTTAQQRTALTLGHAAPDAPLDAVVQRFGQALGAHGASAADLLGAILLGTLDEEGVRLALTSGDCRPILIPPHDEHLPESRPD